MPANFTLTTVREAWHLVGGLSDTSKMPGYSWGIPARYCNRGTKLREAKLPKGKRTVCSNCYGFGRGRYAMDEVDAAYERRLRKFMALGPEQWITGMNFLIQWYEGRYPYFRWCDMGDVQSLEMLEAFTVVAKSCQNSRFWLSTREVEIVGTWRAYHGPWPRNMRVRLSADLIDGPAMVRLAKELGCGVARVVTDGSHTCPASRQKGHCLGAAHGGFDCYHCWSDQFEVVYPEH